MLWSEDEPAARAAFILAWGVFNFFWLVLLRRPLTSAALSLMLIAILIVLSQFKHGVLMMTATFVDLMVIDSATFLFFIRVNSGLVLKLAVAVALTIPVWVLLWRLEPFLVRRSRASSVPGLKIGQPKAFRLVLPIRLVLAMCLDVRFASPWAVELE